MQNATETKKSKVVLRVQPEPVIALLEWLRDKQVTARYIAEHLNVHEVTVCRWYTKTAVPRLSVAQFNKLKELARTVRDNYK